MRTNQEKPYILSAALCGCWSVLSGITHAQTDDERLAEEMQRAKAALEEAIPRAAKDTNRPMFHYRPPARWMNDICGAICYNGWHHVFYQSNPNHDDRYSENGWGHARSKDLVHWEELPLALMPMKHRGEYRCNSGNVALDGNGRPMIFYTWVPQNGGSRSQWTAVPLDDDLIRWRRVGDKPIMERGKDGIPEDKVHPGWSDPYLFEKDGRTFVTFKKVQGMVCEAQDKTLTRWKFLGFMDGVDGECPNVFELDNKCVILRSTHPLSCLTGKLALKDDDIRFAADGPAVPMDYGFGEHPPADRTANFSRGLYGTNTYEDDKGRRILFGWISGFKTGRGWNGCMSLPRILTLDESGQLIQTPAPELAALRGEHTHAASLTIAGEFKPIKGAEGKQLEIITEFIPNSATAFGLKLRSSSDGQRAITLRYADGTLNVAGTAVPLKLTAGQPTLKLHVFLDRSVMEVFVNDGQTAVTRVEYPGEEDIAVGVFAENGQVTLKTLDVWQLKSIWGN